MIWNIWYEETNVDTNCRRHARLNLNEQSEELKREEDWLVTLRMDRAKNFSTSVRRARDVGNSGEKNVQQMFGKIERDAPHYRAAQSSDTLSCTDEVAWTTSWRSSANPPALTKRDVSPSWTQAYWKLIIKDPTAPQMRRYTTLWNTNISNFE